jgi:hypothetical protein
VDYDHGSGDILLQIFPPCADGFGCERSDINQNGTVDFADFAILADDFGRMMLPPGERSDINQNGAVDFADFVILADDFGKMTLPPGAAHIPEPSGIALLLIGGLALLLRRQ